MVFVIAVDKERGKVTLLICLDYVLVSLILRPDSAEIARNDDIIILCEFLLLRETTCVQLLPVVVAVSIACYKNTCHSNYLEK